MNRPVCKSKNAQTCKKKDLLSSIKYKDTIRQNAFFNLEYNKENMVRFNLDNIQQTIASRISEDQTVLKFEKDIPGCIQYFKFKGEHTEEEKMLNKVIPRI